MDDGFVLSTTEGFFDRRQSANIAIVFFLTQLRPAVLESVFAFIPEYLLKRILQEVNKGVGE